MKSPVRSEIEDSALFVLAGILTAFMTALAFSYLWAKERTQRHTNTTGAKTAFLADKHRALSFYLIFSSAYDQLNPPFYTAAMRKDIVSILGKEGGMRVLDVGCGTGYTTQGILNLTQTEDVVGVDINPNQLKRAHRKLMGEKLRVSLSRGDVENLPFHDETFDAVVSVGAIEYFPNPPKALAEMARVVKRGGKVVVGGPELGWFGKVALNRFFYTPSAQEMNWLFEQAGLNESQSILMGVHTFLGTANYVVVTSGTKS